MSLSLRIKANGRIGADGCRAARVIEAITVDFGEFDATLHQFRGQLVLKGEGLARSAPRGVEVDHPRHLALQHHLRKVVDVC